MTIVRVSPLLTITSFMFEALVISQCMPLSMEWTNLLNSKMSCMCSIFGRIDFYQPAHKKHVAIIHFRDECKMINHNGTSRILMIGSKSNGLWWFHITSITPSVANLTCVADSSLGHPSQSTLNLHLWPTRLGHASLPTIRDMSSREIVFGLPSFSKANPFVCIGCAHGKVHRPPFPCQHIAEACRSPGSFLSL